MDIAIVGAHGQIARRLTRQLVLGGDRVRGIIRSPQQVDDLHDDGAEPAVVDVEQTPAEHLRDVIAGCDVVVFAAGAGPGSEAARKETMDYGGAVKLLDAARAVGVRRYVMVSAMGTDNPSDDEDLFSVYLRAKARADQAIMDSDLEWTIVRPGRLTDDPGTGRVSIARHVERGRVPREDVAAVLAGVLREPRTAGQVFELISGETPIDQAVAQLIE